MKQQPAILQIIPHLETGGAELSTLEMVDALSKVGVRALVASEGGRMAPDVVRLGGEVIIMPAATKNPLKMHLNKLRLIRLCRERNIVLLHARSRAPAWSALAAAHRTKTPYVTTYHGAYGENGRLKRLYNSVMARGDKVIANSRFTADLIQSRHKVEDERLRVIYRGVNIERFSRAAISTDRRDELLQKWGIAKDRKIILHPARLTRWKGQGTVIAALKNLIDSGKDKGAMAVIAGDHQGRDSYVAELKSQISAAGLADRVFLVGHCSDMAAAYALAHVTLIASIEPEAFGRTSAEAQAMGCPVIATNIGAPPETVRAMPFVEHDQRTGWLVDPADPEKLAAALEEVLGLADADYQLMAENAVANVTRNFSDDLLKIHTLEIYDQLLGTDFASRYKGAEAD